MELRGYANFVRRNPRSDRFAVKGFHHVEFWCGDATNASRRFAAGLGMAPAARSDQSTGNAVFASYVLRSNELVFAFTAPYSRKADAAASTSLPLPHYDRQAAYDFVASHGLAVRALGIAVEDAAGAFAASVAGGGIPVLPPLTTIDAATGQAQTIAEIKLYGDVVLRRGRCRRRRCSRCRPAAPFLPGCPHVLRRRCTRPLRSLAAAPRAHCSRTARHRSRHLRPLTAPKQTQPKKMQKQVRERPLCWALPGGFRAGPRPRARRAAAALLRPDAAGPRRRQRGAADRGGELHHGLHRRV